jgi:hypothetical protein
MDYDRTSWQPHSIQKCSWLHWLSIWRIRTNRNDAAKVYSDFNTSSLTHYLMKIYQTLNFRLNCTSAIEWETENLIKYMTREMRESIAPHTTCGITTPTSPTMCGMWCIKWLSPAEEDEYPTQHMYKRSERVHTVQFYSTKLSSASELHTKIYPFKNVSLILSATY